MVNQPTFFNLPDSSARVLASDNIVCGDEKTPVETVTPALLFVVGTACLIVGALALASPSVIGIGAVLGVILLVLGVAANESAAKKVSGLLFSSHGQDDEKSDRSQISTTTESTSITSGNQLYRK
ncbi:MAG: hypothetical protein GKR77_04000 [Legionellales bacterium]|nr:hypothetical protein [Legionellales bacterium]